MLGNIPDTVLQGVRRVAFRLGVKVLLAGGIVFFLTAQSLMATGTVKGTVYDRDSKDALPGATVLIRGTSVGASTDLNGNYTIYNAPSGRQTIVVTYVGYRSASEQVTIPDGQTLEKDFPLEATAVQGKVVVVTAQAQGQMQAINQQLTSNKIVSVVSDAKIQELPDFNAAQAISRLPGISVTQSSGEANKVVIRGLAPQYNEVAVGGVTLPSTGSTRIGAISQSTSTNPSGAIVSDRSVDLTMVTPYMIKSIEVYKTLTPDMEANAIGGYVNMELREAPSGLHADALWQSGYTQKSNKYGNYRAVVSGSSRFFNDKLGVYALFNAESYDRNADNMSGGYFITNSENIGANGYLPVRVRTVDLLRHIETRNRYGGNLIFDYSLPSGSIKFVNMLSRLNANYHEYRTLFNYQSNDLGFNYKEGNSDLDIAVNTLRLTNDFGFMSIDFTAANNYSRNHLPYSPDFQFTQTSGVGTSTENTPPQDLTYLINYGGPTSTYLQNISLYSTDYKENDQTYKGDFKFPFNFGSSVSGFFKTGGEFRYNLHNNAQNTPYAGIRGGTPITNLMINGILTHFPQLQYDSSASEFNATNFTSSDTKLYESFLNDRFGGMQWIADPGILTEVTNYVSSDPRFNAIHSSGANPGGWMDGPFQRLANTYRYIEKNYAGYAMAQFNLGPRLMIVGGARFEQVKSLFQAYNLRDGRDPATDTAFAVTVYPQNRFWLPMAQAKYDIADFLDVRYAYTQTLARPAYSELSPHFNMDYSSNNVWGGNPSLRPAHAFNHDVILTFHNNELGLLSVGGFYKIIRDFTFATQYALYATAPAGLLTYPDLSIGGRTPNNKATFYTFLNSPYLAYVKGIEVDFQTRLWYLPGFLNGVVFGLNYTKIQSQATYPWRDSRTDYTVRPPLTQVFDSTRSGRLIDQPNDIMNSYIGYDYKGFSARVSFVFQGNSVSYVGAFAEQDGFTRDYFRVDVSARQQLPWTGLQIYLDANNLNSENNTAAQKSIGGFTSEQNYGLTADLGIRITL